MTLIRHTLPALLLAALLSACTARVPPELQATRTLLQQGPIGVGGVLEGAAYRIDIPANWNGSLVLLLHGYELQGTPRAPQRAPSGIAPVFLARGYAVADSAYSAQGWAVAEALLDIERLRQHFATTYGQPRHTYAVGFSMGGHLALASLERHPEAWSGAVSACGANVPARQIFEQAILEPLVALDHFFPNGLALGAAGLADPSAPAMADPAMIEAALGANEQQAMRLAERLEIARPELPGALWLYYAILQEMEQRAGGWPVDNRNTRYSGYGDDEAYNRAVRRYAGVPAAVEYANRNADLTGRIADPVVILDNAVDPTVPPRFTRPYLELTKAAGRNLLLARLPPVGNGHCAFEPQQIDGAFGVLVDWVEHGKRPAAD